ncbi:MAG: right-handed parallel beta-helix repeat-containing protein, partial [Candidatus Thorarchaeota archaeon]
MHKKSFMIIVLTILLFQPILAGISMPSAKGTIHNPRVVAQGFRVDPSELIDHVPILINGTDDFISQGWTGAGTTNNPYRISSLNITRDVGQICIDIMHTNAYFVIEDCFIKQDSLLDAIRFTNTSHGRIVYTTVYGQDASAETLQAIHLINANNTVVNHVESYGRGAMGLYAVNSYVLTVSDSTFDSDWYRALRVDYSEGLLISNCELSNTPSASWWCVRLDQVNQTTIENSEFYSDNGESGISLYRCFESSISNCYLWGQGVTEVVEFDACPELILHNVTTEFGIYGIFMSSSPGVALSDVTVSESEINGIYIWACANSTFSNVDLTDTGDYGISFTDSSNNSYTDITVTEVFEYGIYGTTSDLLTFEDIHATDIDGDAFFMTSCDNGSIVNSEFHHITDSAIYIDAGANWTVTNNLVEETGANGIYQYQGENFIATDNVVSVCEYGIYVDDSPDALVTNNIVTESTDTAIYGASCDRGVFSNNEIHDSYNGMSFDSSVNLTVSGNTIGVDGWTGIDLYYIITSTIEGNTISNSPYYGITISYYSQELEIIDNVLNDCGFFFMPFTGTWGTPFSYIYFNHTFSGNTINGMDLYYGRDVEGLVLDADDYAQFILLNASDVTIHDGTFDLVTCPIEIIRSENVVIDNVVIPSNIRGIVLASGENVTISDTSITGVNNFGDYYGGIEANYIDNLEVLNCDISRSEGMVIANAELAFVNNTEFSYCDLAIRGYASDNITVSHSSFLDLEGNAFYAFPNGAFTVFTDNMVKNATNGIYIEDPNAIIENNYFWQIDNYAMQLYDVNHIIHNNEIYHAGTYGIYLGGSANFANITENYIESCDI